jgi:hypothetical protein
LIPDEDGFEDFEPVYSASAAYKWRWIFLLVRTLAFVANIFSDVSRLFGSLAEDLSANANYKTEREQFAAEAGRELETLTEGPKED